MTKQNERKKKQKKKIKTSAKKPVKLFLIMQLCIHPFIISVRVHLVGTGGIGHRQILPQTIGIN